MTLTKNYWPLKKPLRELVENYKRKKLNFDKQHETLEPEDDLVLEASIFNHLASKIFIFVMAVILLIVAFNSNYTII